MRVAPVGARRDPLTGRAAGRPDRRPLPTRKYSSLRGETPIAALMAEAGTRPLRVRQAAELLGVSPATVRRWADSGRLVSRRTQERRAPLPPRGPRGATGAGRRRGRRPRATRSGATSCCSTRASSWRRRSTSTTCCSPPLAASAPRSTSPTATSTGSRATTGSSAWRRARRAASTACGPAASSRLREWGSARLGDRGAPRGRLRQPGRPAPERERAPVGARLRPAQLHRPPAHRPRQGDRHDRAARPRGAPVHGRGDRRRRGGRPARRPRHRAGEAVRRGQAPAPRQPARPELGAQRQGLLHARPREPRRRVRRAARARAGMERRAR